MSPLLRAAAVVLAFGLTLGVSAGPGASQAGLPANTWVNMRAGGVALGHGVGDEGFNTFVYAPGIRKGIVFAQYHAVDVGWGEDQNALLAYDFATNRWEILEVTEAAWSEFLPGVGHDQGNATVDTINHLYITRGNMTLHGNTAYQTYAFDLRAGRGRRMMPPAEPPFGSEAATAFSPDHGLVLSTQGASWLYDPRHNIWSEVPGSPSFRRGAALVYDTRHHLFVMFGGGFSDETWTFDPTTRRWTRHTPPVSPPGRSGANIAFDGEHGVTLLVGGRAKGGAQLSDVWTYDAGSDRWSRLSVVVPRDARATAGNNLLYDSDHRVFLLKSPSDLRDVWAFRYEPPAAQQGGRYDAPLQLGAIGVGVAWAAEAPPQPDAGASPPLAPGGWVARRLPAVGQGPTSGKHQRAAFNPENGRIYFLGGDWTGPREMDSGRNEVYSYSVAEDRWDLEYPYCGPAGELQPSHPDEVGWFWDDKRRVFWMLPGYMGVDRGRCAGGATLVRFKPMIFDPRTRKWSLAPFTVQPVGERSKFAVYDPQTDSAIRFYFDGGRGLTSQTINLATGEVSLTVQRGAANGERINNARVGEEYLAIDVPGRHVWVIEPVQGRLYRYDIDTRTLRYEADTPVKNVKAKGPEAYWPWDCAMPIWDPVDQALLWPHIPNFSQPDITLYAYHPDTKTWTQLPSTDRDGNTVRGNVAVFDPVRRALVVMGRSHHVYVYTYTGPGHARQTP
jgi:hypothetical protein